MSVKIVREWAVTVDEETWPDTARPFSAQIVRPERVIIRLCQRPGEGIQVASATACGRRVLKTKLGGQEISASFGGLTTRSRCLDRDAPEWLEKLAAMMLEQIRQEASIA